MAIDRFGAGFLLGIRSLFAMEQPLVDRVAGVGLLRGSAGDRLVFSARVFLQIRLPCGAI